MARTPDATITVLLATHNGAATLPRMLAALRNLERPRRPWRLLVVDNASTDATSELLRAAVRDLPIQVLFCDRPGKAIALGCAAPHVTGDLVVLTDDDVEPCPGWLRAYEDAADTHQQADLFGGPIVPTPIGPTGPWFDASARHHRELFARCEVPDDIVDPVGSVYGPNMMMRAAHLEVLTQAPQHMGPRFDGSWGKRYPMGQDRRLVKALADRGVLARGVPAARVTHLVRPHQTDLEFMLDRAVRHGRGEALDLVGQDRLTWARRLKLIGRFVWRAVRPAALTRERPDPEAFEALWRAHWTRGVILGAAFGPFSRD